MVVILAPLTTQAQPLQIVTTQDAASPFGAAEAQVIPTKGMEDVEPACSAVGGCLAAEENIRSKQEHPQKRVGYIWQEVLEVPATEKEPLKRNFVEVI